MKSISRIIVVIGPMFLSVFTLAAHAQQGAQVSTKTSPAPSHDSLKQAKLEVSQAEQLYQQAQFAAALTNYQRAYTLMEGDAARHRLLMNIGLCEEKLLRIKEAIKSYESYLRLAPPGDPERDEVETRISSLQENAGFLKVRVNPGPGAPLPQIVITIDGQIMGIEDEYMLPPGEHQVLMTPQGFDPQTKEVSLVKAEHQELTFELVDPYKEAKERVSRAEKLYETGNYDAALTEFNRAYETMIGHPARAHVLYNIARCQERLYRYDAAIASYREYLQIAAENETDRPKVEATIESLEGFLGTIVVDVSTNKGAAEPRYEVWVDSHLVGENIKQFSIPGGTHRVEIRAEGFEIAASEVQVPARDQKLAKFRLSPLAKEYKGISKNYFYTATGLTIAAGATGTVFGLLAITQRRQIDQKEPEAVTDDDVDSLKKKALYADIFFISAGVLATSATILAFLTDWSDEPAPKPQPKESAFKVNDLAILPSVQGGYLSLGGTFSW